MKNSKEGVKSCADYVFLKKIMINTTYNRLIIKIIFLKCFKSRTISITFYYITKTIFSYKVVNVIFILNF